MSNASLWSEAAGGERPQARHGDIAIGGRTLRASARSSACAGQNVRYCWSYRMKSTTGLTIVIASLVLLLAAVGGANGIAHAQAYPYGTGGMSVSSGALTPTGASSGGAMPMTLWTDPASGEVFTRPGPGRTPLTLPVATPQIQQDLMQKLQQQEQKTAALEKQVQTIEPAWQDYLGSFKNKVSIGGQFWGDWSLYTHTSWAPQLLTQINPPGPGNNLYNSFDITRAYINIFFNPTSDWTMRITPNIYRTTGTTANQAYGKTGGIGSDLQGDLGFRLKYGYVQWNTPFKNMDIAPIKNDVIVLGQQPQPLTSWEEDLYGYRFVNLTTWNMSISSTYPGISVQGPITFGPENLQYIDYNIGAFDNASFHALEQTNTKEVMGRISVYPFGARWRFDGLGLTTFYDYGYGNVTPDNLDLPAVLKGPNANIQRLAEILHYTADNWQLAFEYDWGRNAWTPGNQYSGSGPAELFGYTPNLPPAAVLNQQAFVNLANALLNNGRTTQQAFNLFGHYHLPDTKFTLFGWINQFNTNTAVKNNPFDWQRFVVGIAYQYNEYLRFAIDEQAILYYHNQYNFPVAYAEQFNYTSPKGFKGKAVPNVVLPDMHTTMVNIEYMF